MKEIVLFLSGRYTTEDIRVFRTLCRGKYKIAVDGGYRFFKKANIVPDLLIGDFDSIGSTIKSISPRTKVISFPKEKNATDSELAFEHAISMNPKRIDIVQPGIGEADHFAGNLMMLTLAGSVGSEKRPKVRIINRKVEILYVKDSSVTIAGKKNDKVSVLPLSSKIRMTTQGLKFRTSDTLIRRGRTHGLRNELTGSRARVTIKGEAAVFHQFRTR
jgi:thiamine pyrophosphokinase